MIFLFSVTDLRSLEEATNELEVKEMLFSRARSKHLRQVEVYSDMRHSMKALATLQNGQKPGVTEVCIVNVIIIVCT